MTMIRENIVLLKWRIEDEKSFDYYLLDDSFTDIFFYTSSFGILLCSIMVDMDIYF